MVNEIKNQKSKIKNPKFKIQKTNESVIKSKVIEANWLPLRRSTYVNCSAQQALRKSRLAHSGRSDDVPHKNGTPVTFLAASRPLRFRYRDGRQLVVASSRMVAQIGQQLACAPNVQIRRETL